MLFICNENNVWAVNILLDGALDPCQDVWNIWKNRDKEMFLFSAVRWIGIESLLNSFMERLIS